MRGMGVKAAILGVVLGVVPMAAQAAGRDGGERRQDRREIGTNKAEARDDWHDAARLDALAQRYDAARRRHDHRAVDAIEAEILAFARTEVRESRAELARDDAEIRKSAVEVRRDGRGRTVPVTAARQDRRDDRRDLRDDQRDAAEEAASLRRHVEISRELESLLMRRDHRASDRVRTLLGELQALNLAEQQSNVQEAREDRQELREDRRDDRRRR